MTVARQKPPGLGTRRLIGNLYEKLPRQNMRGDLRQPHDPAASLRTSLFDRRAAASARHRPPRSVLHLGAVDVDVDLPLCTCVVDAVRGATSPQRDFGRRASIPLAGAERRSLVSVQRSRSSRRMCSRAGGAGAAASMSGTKGKRGHRLRPLRLGAYAVGSRLSVAGAAVCSRSWTRSWDRQHRLRRRHGCRSVESAACGAGASVKPSGLADVHTRTGTARPLRLAERRLALRLGHVVAGGEALVEGQGAADALQSADPGKHDCGSNQERDGRVKRRRKTTLSF